MTVHCDRVSGVPLCVPGAVVSGSTVFPLVPLSAERCGCEGGWAGMCVPLLPTHSSSCHTKHTVYSAVISEHQPTYSLLSKHFDLIRVWSSIDYQKLWKSCEEDVRWRGRGTDYILYIYRRCEWWWGWSYSDGFGQRAPLLRFGHLPAPHRWRVQELEAWHSVEHVEAWDRVRGKQISK